MRALLSAVALLILAACSQTTLTVAAKFSGSNDVTQVDRYLFITSTDRNELRVLDLAPPGATGRRFVQAPNPLEALSVPVLDRPMVVQADAWFDPTSGQRQAGSFVYASRPGAREISIVDATRPTGDAAATATYADVHFREIHRLSLPGPLTAMATSHDAQAQKSRLYVATWDGGRGLLLRYDLPSDASAVAAVSFSVAPTVVTSTSGAPIVAAVAVPPLGSVTASGAHQGRPARSANGTSFCVAEECVAIATRASSGREGRALMLEPSTQRTVELAFPGPVRALSTQGSFTLSPTADTAVDFGPGERIFAILDEEKCGSPDCAGIVAVDTRTAETDGFQVALDSTGHAMQPLMIGQGLFTGLTTVPGGMLLIPGDSDPTGTIASGTSATKVFALLGVAVSSNGGLLFFDAGSLRHIDLDLAPAQLSSYSMSDPSGAAMTWVGGPVLTKTDSAGQETSAVVVADGAWRSQSIAVVWEGPIPGLQNLAADPSTGLTLTLPVGSADRVQPEDIIGFGTADGPCGEAKVASVGPSALTVDQIPAGCAARTTWSLRAGPRAPYVVTAVVTGYQGRAAPGGFVERHDPATFFARQPGYDPAAPTLRIDFEPQTPNVQRDTLWTLNLDGHYAPFVSVIDNGSTSTNCSYRMTLPGTPVYDQVRNLLFISYPSANAVAELKPGLAVRGALTSSQGVLCHQ